MTLPTTAEEFRAALAEPFPADVVQSRPGAKTKDGKKALAYFYADARAVMDRLDDVFGVFGWKDEYTIALDKNVVVCRISARVGGEWVWKEDVGVHAPASDGKSTEDNLDMKYKGVFSDSFKRCAVKWGVGRYLYNVPTIWGTLNQYGNGFDPEPKLPPQFLPRPREEDPAARGRKAADWIVKEYGAAKTDEDIRKVDAVIKDRDPLAGMPKADVARCDDARGQAVRRVNG